jgi:phosphotransferase system HPr-like phosphotransfer protein
MAVFFKINHEHGLHMRVALKLTKLAERFGQSIFIRNLSNNKQATTDNILEMLLLDVKNDDILEFSTSSVKKDIIYQAVLDLGVFEMDNSLYQHQSIIGKTSEALSD